MTENMISVATETIVALLLVITIGYCMLLNSRLKRLRADDSDLRATITELVTATEIAERAINSLKTAAVDCDKTLSVRIREAEYFSAEIAQEISEGHAVLNRIKQIALAARSAERAAGESRLVQATEPPSTAADTIAPVELRASDMRPAVAAIDAKVEFAAEAGVPTLAGGLAPMVAPLVAAAAEIAGARSERTTGRQMSSERIEDLRRMADQARERLQEMRKLNSERAA